MLLLALQVLLQVAQLLPAPQKLLQAARVLLLVLQVLLQVEQLLPLPQRLLQAAPAPLLQVAWVPLLQVEQLLRLLQAAPLLQVAWVLLLALQVEQLLPAPQGLPPAAPQVARVLLLSLLLAPRHLHPYYLDTQSHMLPGRC